jgi:flagellar basal body-associated protein FliL
VKLSGEHTGATDGQPDRWFVHLNWPGENQMADDQEPSPRNMGNFLLWLGVILVAVLAVFLVVFYLIGHKASLMKNSQMQATPASTAIAMQSSPNRLLAFSADLVPRRSKRLAAEYTRRTKV